MKFYVNNKNVKQCETAHIDPDIAETIKKSKLRGLALIQEINRHHVTRTPTDKIGLCFVIHNEDYATAKALNIDISAVVQRALTAAIAAEKQTTAAENAAEECEA